MSFRTHGSHSIQDPTEIALESPCAVNPIAEILMIFGSRIESGPMRKPLSVGIAEVIGSLPLSGLALAVFALVSIVFVATTYDSASYTLAAAATSRLRPGDNPARGHRLFWAAILGILPTLLMFVGGLKVIQSAVLVASLPLLILGVAMSYSLVRSLRDAAE